jgi:hypothetical protein
MSTSEQSLLYLPYHYTGYPDPMEYRIRRVLTAEIHVRTASSYKPLCCSSPLLPITRPGYPIRDLSALITRPITIFDHQVDSPVQRQPFIISPSDQVQ